MTAIIRTRRDTAAALADVNRVYALGEAVWAIDTMEIRYGDGDSNYLDLKPLRMNNGSANVILYTPSLTPEAGDELFLFWYNPGVDAQDANDDEGTPAVPVDFSILGSYTWSGTYNQVGMRSLLMLPGDNFPSVYAYVTPDEFLAIPLEGGQIVTVGCLGAGYSQVPSIWVGVNDDDDLGETNPNALATYFAPHVMTARDISVTNPNFTKNLSGQGGYQLDHVLYSIDQLDLGGGNFTTMGLIAPDADGDDRSAMRYVKSDLTYGIVNLNSLSSGIRIASIADHNLYTTTGSGISSLGSLADAFYISDGAEQDDAAHVLAVASNGSTIVVDLKTRQPRYVVQWYGSINTDSPSHLSDFTGRNLSLAFGGDFAIVDSPTDQHDQSPQEWQLVAIDEDELGLQLNRCGIWIMRDGAPWQRLPLDIDDQIVFGNCSQKNVSTVTASFSTGEETAHFNPIDMNFIREIVPDPDDADVGDVLTVAQHIIGRTQSTITTANNGANTIGSITSRTIAGWSDAPNSPTPYPLPTTAIYSVDSPGPFDIGISLGVPPLFVGFTVHQVEVDVTVNDVNTVTDVFLTKGNGEAYPGNGTAGHAWTTLNIGSTGDYTVTVVLNPPVYIASSDDDIQAEIAFKNTTTDPDTLIVHAARWVGTVVGPKIGEWDLFPDQGDPLLRAMNDPDTARAIELGPDWMISARTLPLTADLISGLARIADDGGATGDRAAQILGLNGLPSVAGDSAVGSTVFERTTTVVVPGLWDGLHLYGQIQSSTPDAWISNTLRIEARAQKMPMGRNKVDTSGYQEIYIIRNFDADPAYSYVEFGVLCVNNGHGSQNHEWGTIDPGLYWYLDYAGTDGEPLEWVAKIDESIDIYGSLNHIVFTMDSTTGDVTLTVNDVSQTVPNVDALDGGFAQPTDENVQAFINGWHGTYLSVGPISGDPASLLDATTASEGQVHFDGWTSAGAEVISCPSTTRMIGLHNLGICNVNHEDIDIRIGDAVGWTLVTRIHQPPYETSLAPISVGGFGEGASAGYALAMGIGAISEGEIQWIFALSDGNQGSNPLAFPSVQSADAFPSGDVTFVARVSVDKQLSVWIDGVKVGSDVDVSGLSNVVPNITTRPLSLLGTGGTASYFAMFHRAISDDEIAYLNSNVDAKPFQRLPNIAGMFSTLAQPSSPSGPAIRYFPLTLTSDALVDGSQSSFSLDIGGGQTYGPVTLTDLVNLNTPVMVSALDRSHFTVYTPTMSGSFTPLPLDVGDLVGPGTDGAMYIASNADGPNGTISSSSPATSLTRVLRNKADQLHFDNATSQLVVDQPFVQQAIDALKVLADNVDAHGRSVSNDFTLLADDSFISVSAYDNDVTGDFTTATTVPEFKLITIKRTDPGTHVAHLAGTFDGNVDGINLTPLTGTVALSPGSSVTIVRIGSEFNTISDFITPASPRFQDIPSGTTTNLIAGSVIKASGNMSGGDGTAVMPDPASQGQGLPVRVTNYGTSNNIIVTPNTTETLDGESSVTVNPGFSITWEVFPDNNWHATAVTGG